MPVLVAGQPDFKESSLEELSAFFSDLGEKSFRAKQVAKWMYQAGVCRFEDMTDLSRDLRGRLHRLARISEPICQRTDQSDDATIKFLWLLGDGERVESVLIPERDHYTLCISSQVGCAMGCRFCRTARIGWRRNLSQAEIVNQVLGARARLPQGGQLTNLVFMGMGEPLANIDNLLRALRILTEPGLIALSRRHLSVSTIGLINEFPHLAATMTVGLTVSLNAADDKLRTWLMPINKRFPLTELHRALAEFPLPHGRRITIAYVLLAGVNDRQQDARQLTKFLHGLKVKVNLIPFNPWPGAEFERPDEEHIETFQEILAAKGYTVIVRKSKGQGVSAACGQLAGGADMPSEMETCAYHGGTSG